MPEHDILKGHIGIFHHVIDRHEDPGTALSRLTVKMQPDLVSINTLDKVHEHIYGFFIRPAVILTGKTQIMNPFALYKFFFRHPSVYGNFGTLVRSVIINGIRGNCFSDQRTETFVLILLRFFQRHSHVRPVMIAIPGDGDAIEQGMILYTAVDHVDVLPFGKYAQLFRKRTELILRKLGAARNIQCIHALFVRNSIRI